MSTALTPEGIPEPESTGLARSLYTALEVARALAISESMVRQLTLQGEIPCRRIGRLVRYSATDISEFVESYDNRGYRSSGRS